MKQIEVASREVEGGHNKAYVRLLSASNKRGVDHGQGRTRRADGHGVCAAKRSHRAGRRRPRADHRAGRLCRLPDRRNPRRQGATSSGIASARRRTLSAARPGVRRRGRDGRQAPDDPPHHQGALDKEKLRLRPQGIKVLSLFFIDAVEQYRQYDADGNPVKGDYARHLRGRIPPAGQASRLPDPVQGSGSAVRRPRRCTTAISRSTRRARGPTPPRTTRATATTPSAPTT